MQQLGIIKRATRLSYSMIVSVASPVRRVAPVPAARRRVTGALSADGFTIRGPCAPRLHNGMIGSQQEFNLDYGTAEHVARDNTRRFALARGGLRPPPAPRSSIVTHPVFSTTTNIGSRYRDSKKFVQLQ
ncbi:hypothetical protein EVAR_3312_1 [Eumeta japonica]|uniref:Uncharacterized protein n=1 Tax=Eumeta variegata TaxID=151549 RepID=A0A4C1SV24_EUMVA|nr:hypothetical protein EVAR_3312_1 [Eumeta japonica]